MIKVLFICHGNICRSTLAQFTFQHMVNECGLSSHFYIDSAATSREEIGNPPHPGTVAKCGEMGIPVLPHRAVQMTKRDYDKFDYLIGMDDWNIRNMMRILREDPEHKVGKLLDFSGNGRDIADPWYTGDFDKTYEDIQEGLDALLDKIKTEQGW